MARAALPLRGALALVLRGIAAADPKCNYCGLLYDPARRCVAQPVSTSCGFPVGNHSTLVAASCLHEQNVCLRIRKLQLLGLIHVPSLHCRANVIYVQQNTLAA